MEGAHYSEPETVVNIFHYELTWRVENVYMCKNLLESTIDGPNFGGENLSLPWALKLGQSENPEVKGISLFIQRVNAPKGDEDRVNFRMSVHKIGEEILDNKFQARFGCGTTWESPIIVTNDAFKAELLSGYLNTFWTITVEMMWNESIDYGSVAEKYVYAYRYCANARKVGHDLKKFFKNEWLSDIYVIHDNQRIPSHRAVLASSCPYFKKKLDRGQEIDDFASFRDPDVVDAFLMFLYSGDIYSIIEKGPLPIGIDELAARTEMPYLRAITRPCSFSGRTSAETKTVHHEWMLDHSIANTGRSVTIDSKEFGVEEGDKFSLHATINRSQRNSQPIRISVSLRLDRLEKGENIYAHIELFLEPSELKPRPMVHTANISPGGKVEFLNVLSIAQQPQAGNLKLKFQCLIHYSRGELDSDIISISKDFRSVSEKPYPDFNFANLLWGWNSVRVNMTKLLINHSMFPDCTIVVQDKRIPCHRVVLAARSPYFAAMFKSKENESAGSSAGMEFPVENYIVVNSDSMRVIIEALYTGSVENLDQKALIRDIRYTAKFFGLESLEGLPQNIRILWDKDTMAARIEDVSSDDGNNENNCGQEIADNKVSDNDSNSDSNGSTDSNQPLDLSLPNDH